MRVVEVATVRAFDLVITGKARTAVTRYRKVWNPRTVSEDARIAGINHSAFKILVAMQEGASSFRAIQTESGLTNIRVRELLDYLQANKFVKIGVMHV